MNVRFKLPGWPIWGKSSTKRRLRDMKKHQVQLENKARNDFLSMAHGKDQDDHVHRMEYHGSQFWVRYFDGESPRGVVQNEPLPQHQYGSSLDHEAMQDRMLNPDSKSCIIPTREKPRQDRLAEIASANEWLDHIRIAEAALAKKEIVESERYFRTALNKCSNCAPDDIKLQRTLIGLAQLLTIQGRYQEAEALLDRAEAGQRAG